LGSQWQSTCKKLLNDAKISFIQFVLGSPTLSTHINLPVSVNTTSAPSATCLCRLPQPPLLPRIPRLGIDRHCTHYLHRNDMAYCHFELCRDCGLGCFSELLLADIRRLSVVAVMFLYQITVFFTTKHNSITFGTLF